MWSIFPTALFLVPILQKLAIVMVKFLLLYLPVQFIYCKCGYFPWGGNFEKMLARHFHVGGGGGNFHDTTSLSFILTRVVNSLILKTIWFYFCVAVILAKKTNARKTQR